MGQPQPWHAPYEEYNYSLNVNGKTRDHGATPADYMVDVLADMAVDFIQRSALRDAGRPFFAYIAPYAPHHPATPPERYKGLFTDAQAPRTPSFNEADLSDKPQWLARKPPLDDRSIEKAGRAVPQPLARGAGG